MLEPTATAAGLGRQLTKVGTSVVNVLVEGGRRAVGYGVGGGADESVSV